MFELLEVLDHTYRSLARQAPGPFSKLADQLANADSPPPPAEVRPRTQVARAS